MCVCIARCVTILIFTRMKSFQGLFSIVHKVFLLFKFSWKLVPFLSHSVTHEATRRYHVNEKQSRFVSLVVKENLVKHGKLSNSYDHDCLRKFILLFMSISTAAIVKDCNILAGIYFIFLRKHPIGNLKVFQYQNLTSVKRSERPLPSKTNFSTFCKFSCSNFRLNLCERTYSQGRSSHQSCSVKKVF